MVASSLAAAAVLLTALASGNCVDDGAFVDSYDWTCRDYARAAEQCDLARGFADAEGVHALDACCVCRRRRRKQLAAKFGEDIVDDWERRRQNSRGACLVECQNDSMQCEGDCDNVRNACKDDCSSAQRTCDGLCGNTNNDVAGIRDGDLIPIRDPDLRDERSETGPQWWVIALIVATVLLCLCLCCGLAYYFLLPMLGPKTADARPSQPPPSPRPSRPSYNRPAQSCNVPQDDEDCGCDDGVPMLGAGSPDYGPRPGIPPHMAASNYARPGDACGPSGGPVYGGRGYHY